MINTQENVTLLKRHLIKYSKEVKGLPHEKAVSKAKDLMIKHKNNLFGSNGLAVWLGEKSIEFFCVYFLQDTFLPKDGNDARQLANVHYELWKDCEKMLIHDDFDKMARAVNRGCAKTTILDKGVSIWAHCYKKSRYTLILGNTELDAIDFVAQVKHEFEENLYLINAFGELINPKARTVNKLELELDNDSKIQALSSTSSPRGKKYKNYRPTLIIADDYQNRKDILTEDAREKKYRAWKEDCEYAGDKAVIREGKKVKMATKFIVIGTILHRDCFMSRILNDKSYDRKLYRVVDFDIDDYFNSGLWLDLRKIYFNNKLADPKSYAKEFYYQHESEMKFDTIWPDKYDCFDLAIEYYTNPIGFKQEMMNDANKIGEKFFHSQATMPREEIEANTFTKTMLCCDPRGTANKSKSKQDYFAFCVGSIADNGFKYVREGLLEQFEYDGYIKKVLGLLITYEDITHLYIEKNTYMGADIIKIKELIEQNPILRHRRIEIINEMQKKNKDHKISTIIGDVDNGRIIFNKENEAFNDQVMAFCGQDFSLHDDAPDCLSEFAIRIDDIHVIGKVTFLDKSKLF